MLNSLLFSASTELWLLILGLNEAIPFEHLNLIWSGLVRYAEEWWAPRSSHMRHDPAEALDSDRNTYRKSSLMEFRSQSRLASRRRNLQVPGALEFARIHTTRIPPNVSYIPALGMRLDTATSGGNIPVSVLGARNQGPISSSLFFSPTKLSPFP